MAVAWMWIRACDGDGVGVGKEGLRIRVAALAGF